MKTQEQDIIDYKKWISEYKLVNGSRVSIINDLSKKFGYKRYLEIGVRDGWCIRRIDVEHKDGVDPIPSEYTNFVMTSDEFFVNLNNDEKYDIIFIDGLHHEYQVYKDILNSLNHLSDNGTIICHDMNPMFEVCQRKIPIVPTWNGDCWKAFVRLKSERSDLEMVTVDVDFGIGVIRIGNQEIIQIPNELEFEFLNSDRKYAMNLITIDEFKEKFQIL